MNRSSKIALILVFSLVLVIELNLQTFRTGCFFVSGSELGGESPTDRTICGKAAYLATAAVDLGAVIAGILLVRAGLKPRA